MLTIFYGCSVWMFGLKLQVFTDAFVFFNLQRTMALTVCIIIAIATTLNWNCCEDDCDWTILNWVGECFFYHFKWFSCLRKHAHMSNSVQRLKTLSISIWESTMGWTLTFITSLFVLFFARLYRCCFVHFVHVHAINYLTLMFIRLFDR